MKFSHSKLILVCLALILLTISCSWEDSEWVEKTFIAITFDDQHISIYETALPLLNKFGMPGINVINTGRIGRPELLNWEQVEELEFQHGWETAGHSLTHPNLPDLTYDEVFYQIEQDWLNLKERGLSHETFVLPRGHATERDYEIISQFYRNIRNSRDLHMYYPIDRLNIGYFAYLTSYSADDAIRRITEGVINKEALVVIGFHRFGDPYHTHSCSAEDLFKILQFIADQRLEVITLKEAAQLLN